MRLCRVSQVKCGHPKDLTHYVKYGQLAFASFRCYSRVTPAHQVAIRFHLRKQLGRLGQCEFLTTNTNKHQHTHTPQLLVEPLYP